MADAGFKICGAILERSGVDQSKIWSFLTNLIKNWKNFEEIEKKKIPPFFWSSLQNSAPLRKKYQDFDPWADAIRELTKTAREQADTIYERGLTFSSFYLNNYILRIPT